MTDIALNTSSGAQSNFDRLLRYAVPGAIFLHVLIWTLLPSFLLHNASLDMIEGLAWGREWQLGYEKDPPLFAWLIEIGAAISGKNLWFAYLEAQLCIATVFFAIWRLARMMVSEVEALVAVLLLEGVYYVNFPTPEFNDIILQKPFAALFVWLLYRALRDDRLGDWAFAGLAAAGGLYARYSMGAYIIPLAAFIAFHPLARQRLSSIGPWLCGAVATLAFLPHLYWIVQSHFISILYVGDRAEAVSGLVGIVEGALTFIASQVLALLPAIVISVVLWRWRDPAKRIAFDFVSFDKAYITFAALGPVVTSLLISFASGHKLRSMWGAPLWCSITLFAVMMIRPVLTEERLRRFGWMWLTALVLPALMFVQVQLTGAHITKREKRTHFPGTELAQEVTAHWHDVSGAPLRYVVGDTWLAGNVAFYSPDRPSVFTFADARLSPWIDETDLRRSGGVLIWNAKQEGKAIPVWLAAKYPRAVVEPAVNLPGDVSVHCLGWALLPPDPDADISTSADHPAPLNGG
ncbi:MAG: glycosyltransferase family 39 protein [Parvibaculum sp.]|uniref:glycosyltransferase family 39 protein n=1 Tax=Parvibaculum sp. TaxID=2024848 RepID=UPI0028422A09|nr:glycosyltransferase family 39 protein [Parvibaculum sp.]MDR3500543.1 glycosyltransferase family 39 protein [Parvibaculum sp.]